MSRGFRFGNRFPGEILKPWFSAIPLVSGYYPVRMPWIFYIYDIRETGGDDIKHVFVKA